MKLLGAFLLANLAVTSVQAQVKGAWKVTQAAWTEAHERQFGEFVTSIGMAVESRQCGKVDQCLRSPANPYFKSDPAGLNYFSDCADLPYYLRSYFAWKNGLPMSVVSGVKAKAVAANEKPSTDIRYSTAGNYVTNRYDVVPKLINGKMQMPSALNILNNTIPNYTSSASFRMPGISDDTLWSDFYPAALTREAIRPGTVIYDPNGHVAIVYRVTDDGRVFYMDAHPDNSLTRGMFTPKFVRSKPAQGAGFKNFRPLKLVNAKKDAATGTLYGGQLVATPNAQLPLYGTEQFFGNQPDPGGAWNKGKFLVSGQAVNFYDYLRMKLMKGDIQIDPLNDMAQLTDDICVSLKDRVDAVQAARTAGMDQKPHPARLPENIYGTSGDWEEYSSPSRDARLKVSFQDLVTQTKANVERYNKRDPSIKYNGGNLANDLLSVYAERAKACVFSYTTTNNQSVMMNLEAARLRLWDMSFDPYHCVERRWGARNPQELASCRDDANKTAWYQAEKWLRYQSERRYDARMDYSLSELKGPLPSAGIAAPEDIDIVGYLKSMR